MKVVDVLKAARAKIAKPEHFTKGAFCRDEEGNPLDLGDDQAVCWCVYGAFPPSDGTWIKADAIRALGEEMLPNVYAFNDSHTHAEVLAAFDRTIAKLEAE